VQWCSSIFVSETKSKLAVQACSSILITWKNPFLSDLAVLFILSYSMMQVAALVPKTELDGQTGDAHVALQARLMSQALRKLSHSLSLSQTILLFINQTRAKVATFGFGGPTEVTSCGNALKFYASVHLNIKRIGLVKKGEEVFN